MCCLEQIKYANTTLDYGTAINDLREAVAFLWKFQFEEHKK